MLHNIFMLNALCTNNTMLLYVAIDAARSLAFTHQVITQRTLFKTRF